MAVSTNIPDIYTYIQPHITEVTPVRGQRMYSVLTVRNKIVAEGSNLLKTHPFQARFARNAHSVFFHSETHVIWRALRAGVDLSRCTLYIARISRAGQWALARPCAGCLDAIHTFNIPRVFYTSSPQVCQML